MKLTFLKIILKKVDVDLLDPPNSGDYQAKMEVDREVVIEESKKNKNEFRFKVRTNYSFPIANRNQKFVFVSLFSIDYSEGEEFSEDDETLSLLAKRSEAIIQPQEITIIKNHLALYGVNFKDSIPLGVPVNV